MKRRVHWLILGSGGHSYYDIIYSTIISIPFWIDEVSKIVHYNLGEVHYNLGEVGGCAISDCCVSFRNDLSEAASI